MVYFWILCAIALCVVVYSITGAHRLCVKQVYLSCKSAFLDGKTVAVFSDVHVGTMTPVSRLEKCARIVENSDSDIILFVGDFADKHKKDYRNIQDQCANILNQLQAAYGKYAVLGNNDLHMPQAYDFAAQSLTRGGFRILENESVLLSNACMLYGISSVFHRTPQIDQPDRNCDNILLCHEPDFFDDSRKMGFDLQISGHSHGGQVYLPPLSCVTNPRMAKKYYRGVYKANGSTLVVSHGVGVHTFPNRLFARPDVVLIHFEKQ